MRVVIQRVSEASVTISGTVHSQISKGLVILLGIESTDGPADIEWLVHKIASMRIFEDDDEKMNLSIQDIHGEFMVISQFTLHASTKKGNRPSFIQAARPEIAQPLYDEFLAILHRYSNLVVRSGMFGVEMQVRLTNDGPVTIVMDSKQKV